MSEYALRLESGVDTAPRLRIADAMQMAAGDSPLSARSGVRGAGGAVTVTDGTMGVSVAPFSAWVDGGSTDAQGGFPVVLDAAKALTLADGHATLDRVDTIAVVIHDDAFDGSGDTSCTVTVVQGTPGGDAPTLPTTCLPLQDVNVPHGVSAGTGGLASSNLGADRRKWTSALGGLLPVGSATDRDALSPYPGMPVYRLDADRIEVWNGSSWDEYRNSNDTGWTALLGLFDSGSGFITQSGCRVRKIGNQVTLDFVATSASYSSSGGNISDITVCNLPSQWRPSSDVRCSFSVSFRSSGQGIVKANGDILLQYLDSPGYVSGDALATYATYLTD